LIIDKEDIEYNYIAPKKLSNEDIENIND